MTAVLAILVDSYRELIAKKLFWFVLAISLLIVLSFGSIGFNDKGVSIGYGLYTIENEVLKAESPLIGPFMDFAFASVIVSMWLAWGAIILALISTAEIFPNFLAGGAIDLILSKPVRRTTVFFSKYLGSLLFVLLQVAIFCVGVLLVMRWRVGEWRWPILLAVPILVLVFSYLYSLMVLFNVVTRSTLPSLVLTLLAWLALFTLHTTDGILLTQFRIRAEVDRDAYARRIEWYEQRLNEAAEQGDNDAVNRYRTRLAADEAALAEAQHRVEKWMPISQAANLATLLLPKTSSTTNIVQRQLQSSSGMTTSSLMSALNGDQPDVPEQPESYEDDSQRDMYRRRDQEIMRRAEEYENSRPWWKIIGTSLIFEGLVLAVACFIFVRRDN
ncbi:MAG: ABC transporter permease [Phycisphaerales bacterium]|nr:ABC transporter permease [Phycisphaerales bacterium]